MFSYVSVSHSVHRGGVVSQHALQVASQHVLQVSRRGGVSQHALQVSRPTAKGEVEGSGWGDLQAHNRGGSPGPHPEGSPGPHLEGLQAHTQGGVSQHALRQTPLTATAVGSTHHTGMHSCFGGHLVSAYARIFGI